LLSNYSYLCQPVDYSQSELGMKVQFCTKFASDPAPFLGVQIVFFTLNKKQEQVTFLHVYHHGTTLFNWWPGIKYVPGNKATFFGGDVEPLHTHLHVHYILASLGPQMQCYLSWKHYLPIMRVCQFVAIATHSSYSFFTESPFPDSFNTAVFLYILRLGTLSLHYCQRMQKKL
ncbi:ELOV4 protein, partial [Nothocercus julius]|nr:ELOV4 protein [Nothocercus julius]